MSLPRPPLRTRRHLATWLVGVLLLTQWMVAAYACAPRGGAAGAPGTAPGFVAAVAADLPPCHAAEGDDRDGGQPNLCKAHCSADAQLPGASATADAPVPSLGWCLVAAPLALLPADVAELASSAPRAGAPPGWPPLFLTHRVLRN